MAWFDTSMLASWQERLQDRMPSEMAFLWCWFLAVMALGAAGIWGALGLLGLRASGRALLEKVNFISAGLIALYGLYWAHSVLSMRYLSDLELKLSLAGGLLTCLSSVPFLWMAKALRGRDVQNACQAGHR